MGGIASGQSRRERRALRDGLAAALEGDYTVNGVTADGMTQVCIALAKRAMEGDPRAFTVLRDTLEGQPTQRVEIGRPSPEDYARVAAILGELEGEGGVE